MCSSSMVIVPSVMVWGVPHHFDLGIPARQSQAVRLQSVGQCQDLPDYLLVVGMGHDNRPFGDIAADAPGVVRMMMGGQQVAYRLVTHRLSNLADHLQSSHLVAGSINRPGTHRSDPDHVGAGTHLELPVGARNPEGRHDSVAVSDGHFATRFKPLIGSHTGGVQTT